MEVEARSGSGDKQSGVKNIRWKQVTDIMIHCRDRKLSLRSEHKVRQSGMRGSAKGKSGGEETQGGIRKTIQSRSGRTQSGFRNTKRKRKVAI